MATLTTLTKHSPYNASERTFDESEDDEEEDDSELAAMVEKCSSKLAHSVSAYADLAKALKPANFQRISGPKLDHSPCQSNTPMEEMGRSEKEEEEKEEEDSDEELYTSHKVLRSLRKSKSCYCSTNPSDQGNQVANKHWGTTSRKLAPALGAEKGVGGRGEVAATMPRQSVKEEIDFARGDVVAFRIIPTAHPASGKANQPPVAENGSEKGVEIKSHGDSAGVDDGENATATVDDYYPPPQLVRSCWSEPNERSKTPAISPPIVSIEGSGNGDEDMDGGEYFADFEGTTGDLELSLLEDIRLLQAEYCGGKDQMVAREASGDPALFNNYSRGPEKVLGKSGTAGTTRRRIEASWSSPARFRSLPTNSDDAGEKMYEVELEEENGGVKKGGPEKEDNEQEEEEDEEKMSTTSTDEEGSSPISAPASLEGASPLHSMDEKDEGEEDDEDALPLTEIHSLLGRQPATGNGCSHVGFGGGGGRSRMRSSQSDYATHNGYHNHRHSRATTQTMGAIAAGDVRLRKETNTENYTFLLPRHSASFVATTIHSNSSNNNTALKGKRRGSRVLKLKELKRELSGDGNYVEEAGSESTRQSGSGFPPPMSPSFTSDIDDDELALHNGELFTPLGGKEQLRLATREFVHPHSLRGSKLGGKNGENLHFCRHISAPQSIAPGYADQNEGFLGERNRYTQSNFLSTNGGKEGEQKDEERKQAPSKSSSTFELPHPSHTSSRVHEYFWPATPPTSPSPPLEYSRIPMADEEEVRFFPTPYGPTSSFTQRLRYFPEGGAGEFFSHEYYDCEEENIAQMGEKEEDPHTMQRDNSHLAEVRSAGGYYHHRRSPPLAVSDELSESEISELEQHITELGPTAGQKQSGGGLEETPLSCVEGSHVAKIFPSNAGEGESSFLGELAQREVEIENIVESTQRIGKMEDRHYYYRQAMTTSMVEALPIGDGWLDGNKMLNEPPHGLCISSSTPCLASPSGRSTTSGYYSIAVDSSSTTASLPPRQSTSQFPNGTGRKRRMLPKLPFEREMNSCDKQADFPHPPTRPTTLPCRLPTASTLSDDFGKVSVHLRHDPITPTARKQRILPRIPPSPHSPIDETTTPQPPASSLHYPAAGANAAMLEAALDEQQHNSNSVADRGGLPISKQPEPETPLPPQLSRYMGKSLAFRENENSRVECVDKDDDDVKNVGAGELLDPDASPMTPHTLMRNALAMIMEQQQQHSHNCCSAYHQPHRQQQQQLSQRAQRYQLSYGMGTSSVMQLSGCSGHSSASLSNNINHTTVGHYPIATQDSYYEDGLNGNLGMGQTSLSGQQPPATQRTLTPSNSRGAANELALGAVTAREKDGGDSSGISSCCTSHTNENLRTVAATITTVGDDRRRTSKGEGDEMEEADPSAPTHRAQFTFTPRHGDELALEIGDPIHVGHLAEDHWCYGVNLRTQRWGIFPVAHICEVDLVEEICHGALTRETRRVSSVDGSSTGLPHTAVAAENDTFYLTMLGSVEVAHHKGNDVLAQAITKVCSIYQRKEEIVVPQTVLMEISFRGVHVIDKRKKDFFRCPTFDYFYSLQNISFCGAHPKQLRYFGFISKHPLLPRFACHVFLGQESTQPIVESIGRAFKRSYDEYMAFAHPTEDIFIE